MRAFLFAHVPRALAEDGHVHTIMQKHCPHTFQSSFDIGRYEKLFICPCVPPKRAAEGYECMMSTTARGLPFVIRRYSNFGSPRLSLFADPIKYVAWVPQIDSRSTFFLHSMVGLHCFAVFPQGFCPDFRLNL